VTESAEQPAKRTSSLTGFYVALGVIVALALFGTWFWRAWTVWWFDADEAKRRQAKAAVKLGVPVEKVVDFDFGVKLELVLIPAGRFKMGSPPEEKGRKEDETQHWVTITRSFYLGKHEVTWEQWQIVMGPPPTPYKEPRMPVTNVSWNDCQEFLNELNAIISRPGPAPSGARVQRVNGQFRLPTEAEWEWACRAGTHTRFCSGTDNESLMEHAWFNANSGGSDHPVGGKRANAWGLHDMHGNVWEWCGDRYGEYGGGGASGQDPQGPATGSERVWRGGSFGAYGAPDICRSASRFADDPEDSRMHGGFRVVLVPARP
jgi:formylglycine-generating enzyme required for sulfatase activity